MSDDRLAALDRRLTTLEEETGALWLVLRVCAQRLAAADASFDLTAIVQDCVAATADFPDRHRALYDLAESIRQAPRL